MIGVDTNVLVRYLVQDDAKQAAAAKRFFDKARTSGEELFINNIVLCELVWVLDSVYGITKQDIVSTIKRLSATTQICFEASTILGRTVDAFATGKADFADYLIGAVNAEVGASTVTFDKALKANRNFRLL